MISFVKVWYRKYCAFTSIYFFFEIYQSYIFKHFLANVMQKCHCLLFDRIYKTLFRKKNILSGIKSANLAEYIYDRVDAPEDTIDLYLPNIMKNLLVHSTPVTQILPVRSWNFHRVSNMVKTHSRSFNCRFFPSIFCRIHLGWC